MTMLLSRQDAAIADAHEPTIDRAEALLLEIIDIMPRLNERDRSNIGHAYPLPGTPPG